MGYYIFMDGNYITQICKTSTGTGNATEADYNAVIAALQNRPEGNYRLRADTLEWEEYEAEPEPEPSDDDEIDAYEAMTIVTGGRA